MKKGFTLIEMLVVIGIITILTGASLAAFSKMTRSAEKTKCEELVKNTATALAYLYQQNGAWPRLLRSSGSGAKLDQNYARALANNMGLTLKNDVLAGNDRFGIVTPWAQAVLKRRGTSASLGDRVTNGTLEDHILHFAIDLDGDGIITGIDVGGETVNLRATAAVWCCGRDGVLEPYSKGLRKDDVYSWSHGQTESVQ